MNDLDAYCCAMLVLGEPDPDAFVQERLDEVADDPAMTELWQRVRQAIEALRTDAPTAGQPVQ